jgi:hypothetical protein
LLFLRPYVEGSLRCFLPMAIRQTMTELRSLARFTGDLRLFRPMWQ